MWKAWTWIKSLFARQDSNYTVNEAIDATLQELYPDLSGTRHFAALQEELARKLSIDYNDNQHRFVEEFLGPVREFLLILRSSKEIWDGLLAKPIGEQKKN
ncbi:hypothetical protein LSAT2_028036 [Lamellibrachia satsuma]|nr:hypothetical protein LSAT2_028036 [Lamellibrachia satsuma]